MKKTFRAKLGSDAEHALFIVIPFDVKEAFGKARPPVKLTVNGHAYRTTVAVYGGKYYVPVRREHRDAAGVAAGQMVSVTIEADTEPRVVEPPPDLATALKKNKKASGAWEKLAYTHKKEHADAIAGAKKPETRARRVEKAIEMLAATPARATRVTRAK